jgi:tRNA G18 (ribose-2'-O)-methylase SpoU
MRQGFFAIGIEHGKTKENVGTLWRSADILGASWIFTVGGRYQKQPSDTMKTWQNIPLFNFSSLEDFWDHIPYDCPVVGVELDKSAQPIIDYQHRERCMYLLGAEDHGLTQAARSKVHDLIVLPGRVCHNVSVAGALVMYDRYVKGTEPSVATMAVNK